MRAITVCAVAAAFAGLLALDYESARVSADIGQEIRELPMERPDHERCAKHTPDFRTLRHEVAQRADGGPWVIDCAYTED